MMQLADNILGQPHKWAAEIKAWADGRLVQWRYVMPAKVPEPFQIKPGFDEWRDCSYPSRGQPNWSNPQMEFRIPPNEVGSRTGWPAELMQDQSSELSKALANTPGAKLHAKEASEILAQSIWEAHVEIPEQFKELCDVVNNCPITQSLLYDLNLLPEQTSCNCVRFSYTLSVVKHIHMLKLRND